MSKSCTRKNLFENGGREIVPFSMDKKLSRLQINLDGEPLSETNYLNAVSVRPDNMYLVFITNGGFEYIGGRYRKRELFRFCQAFTNPPWVKVESYQDLVRLAQVDKGIKFALEYTTFNQDYFDWARANPGHHFYFHINYPKFERHIKERCFQLGLDYNGGAFLIQRKQKLSKQVEMLRKQLEKNREKLEKMGEI